MIQEITGSIYKTTEEREPKRYLTTIGLGSVIGNFFFSTERTRYRNSEKGKKKLMKSWCALSIFRVCSPNQRLERKKFKNAKTNSMAGLCISPIFVSRDVSEMQQNWHRIHVGNARIKSTHRWIANVIVSLITSGDLGNVPRYEYWRNCVHFQETLTGTLLISITVEMIDKISYMPDGKILT
jgi:hypothetical protein